MMVAVEEGRGGIAGKGSGDDSQAPEQCGPPTKRRGRQGRAWGGPPTKGDAARRWGSRVATLADEVERDVGRFRSTHRGGAQY
jgi:hypothetical protein